MRFLHTSDLHLGLSLFSLDLLPYQAAMLTSLADAAARENVDAVIVAGDVFDRALPPAEAVALWSGFTGRLCAGMGIPCYVIAGNHDGGVRLASCSDLLEKGGLVIAGVPGQPAVRTVGDTDLVLLPWSTAEDVRAAVPTGSDVNKEEALAAWIDAAASACTAPHRLAVWHGYAAGGERSDSERAWAGTADAVPSGLFDGFDATAAGHLHRRQTTGKVHYSGSPLPYSFGEITPEKTVTLHDTASGLSSLLTLPQPYRLQVLTGTTDEVVGMADGIGGDTFVRCDITGGFDGFYSDERLRAAIPTLLQTVVRRENGGSEVREFTTERLPALSPRELLERYLADTAAEADGELLDWFESTVKKLTAAEAER